MGLLWHWWMTDSWSWWRFWIVIRGQEWSSFLWNLDGSWWQIPGGLASSSRKISIHHHAAEVPSRGWHPSLIPMTAGGWGDETWSQKSQRRVEIYNELTKDFMQRSSAFESSFISLKVTDMEPDTLFFRPWFCWHTGMHTLCIVEACLFVEKKSGALKTCWFSLEQPDKRWIYKEPCSSTVTV